MDEELKEQNKLGDVKIQRFNVARNPQAIKKYT